jgi:hypothetical protein
MRASVAHGLLSHPDIMAVEPGCWQKLNPSTIECVPDAPGIFEIANLVRTVLYIGRANGDLRRRLAELGAIPENVPASPGGYWIRYALAEDEEAALTARQDEHRTRHGGQLPPGNEARPRPKFRLITRHAA